MMRKEHPKILAVDDEENFLHLLSHTLQKEGYEVRTALDGPEALRRLEQEEFDLALIDVRMTPMDGLHLIHLPVVNQEGQLIGLIERSDILLGYLESRLGPLQS